MSTITLFLGCRQVINDPDWNNPFPSFDDTFTLKYKTTHAFILDAPTILKNESFQFNDIVDKVIAYNSANSDLVMFDYTTGQISKKLNLIKVGIPPHAVGVIKAYSFKFLNYDSIFFYDQKKEKVFLFDSSRNLRFRYEVSSNKNRYSVGRLLSGLVLPISKEHIYVASAPGRDPLDLKAPLRENLFLDISLKDSSTRPFAKYPEIYKKARWGYYFHAFYSTFNEISNKIIISYPIEHWLFVIDSSRNISRHYAGSVGIKNVIPLRFAKENNEIKKDEEIKHFLSQRKYANILFDKYRNLYYRIASTSIPEADFANMSLPNYVRQPFSIIILNSEFQKVGEAPIDANKYSTISMFVSPEGLCIPSSKSNDDKIVFDVFTLEKN